MIIINGDIKKNNEYFISPMSEGLAYGFGLFETLKVYDKKVMFLHEHLKRMRDSCFKINFPFNYEENDIENLCNRIIDINKINFGAIKLSYIKNFNEYDFIISSSLKVYNNFDYEKGFKLCISNFKRNPYSLTSFLKSNNYLENILAREMALELGFNEALFLNINDEICEGTISNIFFVKNDTVYTPSIDCGLLDGIIRQKVIDLLKNLNIRIITGKFKIEFLKEIDEVFITNSLMEIMPVSMIENKIFTKRDMITFLKKEFYKRYYDW